MEQVADRRRRAVQVAGYLRHIRDSFEQRTLGNHPARLYEIGTPSLRSQFLHRDVECMRDFRSDGLQAARRPPALHVQ
ncbi:MAG: hypothetical protein IPF84_02395 [Proteobacteria bacterium]|nr:hypothetical protein [Pseudomonadota bacterium]